MTGNFRLRLWDENDAVERERLVSFLSGQTWTYHGNARPTAESVREGMAQGRYAGEETRTFWVVETGAASLSGGPAPTAETIVGLVRVFDLGDSTPVFDVRIGEAHRGRGIGTEALRRLADYVFTEFPDKERLEGHTRADNYAMRKAFYKAGFVKEAVHRRSWPSADGTMHDSIGYSIIRPDWAEGKRTPIDWNDFPY